MISATIMNNTNKVKTVLDENTTTLREAFEANGFPVDGITVLLNGVAVRAGDIDRTFAELGVDTSASLFGMAKADNATR